jgi:uncharacterized protein YjbJ (UPF0337 family)
MKESTTDQVTGTLRELKGAAKEKLGRVTDNPKLTAEGQGDQIAGKVQKKLGQIKKVFDR